jgi:hypothetical protein
LLDEILTSRNKAAIWLVDRDEEHLSAEEWLWSQHIRICDQQSNQRLELTT